jgi:hypothetical protein
MPHRLERQQDDGREGHHGERGAQAVDRPSGGKGPLIDLMSGT